MRYPLSYRVKEIKELTLKICNISKDCLSSAVNSLSGNVNERKDYIEKVFDLEEESDLINLQVDEKVASLIATQQPVGKDLRFAINMLKISSNFERICDLSTKIAIISKKYLKNNIYYIEKIFEIKNVLDDMFEIVRNSIETFNIENLESTLKSKDDIVDDLHIKFYKKVIDDLSKDNSNVEQKIDSLFIARYLERIGDILGKTGARIIFIETGKWVWIK